MPWFSNWFIGKGVAMFNSQWIQPQGWPLMLALAATVSLAGSTAYGAHQKGKAMSYREAKDFLARHTKVVELTNKEGGRVAVCPEWQGRVMTSSCDGPNGISFGFINREFIEAGKPDAHFNNYGAEDRFWLSPEGGPYSLWFEPGVEQNSDNWYTPPALNEGAYEMSSKPESDVVRMSRVMKVRNTANSEYELSVIRVARLLGKKDYSGLFGAAAAKILAEEKVKKVGFETINTITNIGAGKAMNKERGLLSIWILGMFNASPKTVIIVPYKTGDESKLGPVVKSDYFGTVPPERLKVTPEAILFMGDAKYRSKIGTSQKRAKDVLGSIDFEHGVLTLVSFSMPKDPTKADYMNNMWGKQDDSYVGDVANSYNDGPLGPGKKGLGPFYEIESLSPAETLLMGKSLTHYHRTLHVQADMATLGKLAEEVLGVDLKAVQKEMLGK